MPAEALLRVRNAASAEADEITEVSGSTFADAVVAVLDELDHGIETPTNRSRVSSFVRRQDVAEPRPQWCSADHHSVRTRWLASCVALIGPNDVLMLA